MRHGPNRRLFSLVAGCAGVALALTASPAQAGIPAGGLVDPDANGGYLITPTSLRSVSSSWIVPTVTCTAPRAAVGMGILLGDRDTGHLVTLSVDAHCKASTPSYAVWLLVEGQRPAKVSSKVRPGDHIVASMKASPRQFSATISDDSRGWAGGISGPAGFAADQAGILAFQTHSHAVGGYHPLADFGTIAFTNSRINGKPVDATLRRLDMRSHHSIARVRTSRMKLPEGEFTVTYASVLDAPG